VVVEATVCVVGAEVLGGGTVVVAIAVVVATAVDVAAVVAVLEAELDVAVVLEVFRGLSGGTGTSATIRVTDTWDAPPGELVASGSAAAGADVDLTALPTAKPMAIATTSAPPSSHHRCFTFTASPSSRFRSGSYTALARGPGGTRTHDRRIMSPLL
jgi:hypothetical protein